MQNLENVDVVPDRFTNSDQGKVSKNAKKRDGKKTVTAEAFGLENSGNGSDSNSIESGSHDSIDSLDDNGKPKTMEVRNQEFKDRLEAAQLKMLELQEKLELY